MRRKKRPVVLLLFGILSIVSLIYIIVSYPPSAQFPISNFQFPIVYAFFSLFFLSFFSLIAYLFNNVRRGMFAGIFVAAYLYLRLAKLTNPFFFILILALFVTIELFFSRQK